MPGDRRRRIHQVTDDVFFWQGLRIPMRGLLDHRELVRILATVPEGAHASPI